MIGLAWLVQANRSPLGHDPAAGGKERNGDLPKWRLPRELAGPRDAHAETAWRSSAAAVLLPAGTSVKTWKELNPDLAASMKLERMGAFLALLLITLVATFNIMGTISRSAIERRHRISHFFKVAREYVAA